MAEVTTEPENGVLENEPVNVKLKLAALWTSVMLINVYVDSIGYVETIIR